ncbi:hypothetical protein [Actinosynnema sp. ALI-1.44]|uniref:hypothetical protein n=1 Tax=Actinosynnema sp. ALI-1.44 TaxID=1933779 RepID=UPI0011778CBC|nr:hypothetical protein [Actinosynnema sp. ALI-1.44]
MRVWPILCVVLLAGCTQTVQGTAVSPAGEAKPAKPANLALVDTKATEDVLAATKRAVEGVFSFAPADPGAQQQAVTKYLTGSALSEVEKLLGPVRQSGTTITAKVHDAAVSELTDTTARVLVMVDQTGTRPGGPPTTGGASILVVGQREQGAWRFNEITANPALKSVPKAPGDPVADARDQGVAAAYSGVVTLMSLDGNDIDNSLKRQQAATTDPLLTELRQATANSAQQLRESRTNVTVARDPMVAAKTATADVVTGLALVKTTVSSTATPQPAERVLRIEFEMAKTADGWKLGKVATLQVTS